MFSSLLQRGMKWLNYLRWTNFRDYTMNSVALFLKVPYFCFLGCLKEVAKPYFQDLKAFWCKIWKLLIAVSPILYSIIKNALCRPTWMHNIFRIYWQCCFTVQPDDLGPWAPKWCIHWCTHKLNSVMRPLIHSKIEFNDASTDASRTLSLLLFGPVFLKFLQRI